MFFITFILFSYLKKTGNTSVNNDNDQRLIGQGNLSLLLFIFKEKSEPKLRAFFDAAIF
jgi:hypothetical protein